MNNTDHVLAFYSRHPISHDQILAAVLARRGHLDNLAAADLFAFDQDHYGGLAARVRVVRGDITRAPLAARHAVRR